MLWIAFEELGKLYEFVPAVRKALSFLSIVIDTSFVILLIVLPFSSVTIVSVIIFPLLSIISVTIVVPVESPLESNVSVVVEI